MSDAPYPDGPATDDPRRFAPATLRNRDVILDVLRTWLPGRGTVLEVASGSGEHVCHFAAALPDLMFQPSDPNPDARLSIDAWVAASDLDNVRPALELDASAAEWPVARMDVVVCINMIHIAPWQATLGLIAGAARALSAGGMLFLYGPYRRDGAHTSESNAAFDLSLRERDPRWGVRDLEAVLDVARSSGFFTREIVEMPANNLSVILRC